MPPLRKEIHFPKQREHVVRSVVEEPLPELIKEFVEFPKPTAPYDESPMVLEPRCLPAGPEEAIGQYVRLNFEKQLTARERRELALRKALEQLGAEQRQAREQLVQGQREQLAAAQGALRNEMKQRQRDEFNNLKRKQREAHAKLLRAPDLPQLETTATWKAWLAQLSKRLKLRWDRRRERLWLRWDRLFAHRRPEETIVLLLARVVDAAVLADRFKDGLRKEKQWNAMPFYERIYADYKRIWFPFDCLLAPITGSEMMARVVIETNYDKVFLQALFGDRTPERERALSRALSRLVRHRHRASPAAGGFARILGAALSPVPALEVARRGRAQRRDRNQVSTTGRRSVAQSRRRQAAHHAERTAGRRLPERRAACRAAAGHAAAGHAARRARARRRAGAAARFGLECAGGMALSGQRKNVPQQRHPQPCSGLHGNMSSAARNTGPADRGDCHQPGARVRNSKVGERVAPPVFGSKRLVARVPTHLVGRFLRTRAWRREPVSAVRLVVSVHCAFAVRRVEHRDDPVSISRLARRVC